MRKLPVDGQSELLAECAHEACGWKQAPSSLPCASTICGHAQDAHRNFGRHRCEEEVFAPAGSAYQFERCKCSAYIPDFAGVERAG